MVIYMAQAMCCAVAFFAVVVFVWQNVPRKTRKMLKICMCLLARDLGMSRVHSTKIHRRTIFCEYLKRKIAINLSKYYSIGFSS